MRTRNLVVFLVLLALLVLLCIPLPASMWLKRGARDNFALLPSGFSFLASKARETIDVMTDARGVIAEGARLQEEITRLRHDLRRMAALERDNRELRKQLGFKSRQKHELVMCEVVVRLDSSGWWQTVRLNRGASAGIGPDMAVVTSEGLIGRTTIVSDRTCDVLLITDETCRVACRLSGAGAFGIVKGMGVSSGGTMDMEMLCAVKPCMMEYIRADATVSENDEVMTSGLGGAYPEGLLVGRLKTVEQDSSGLYQRANVEPAADMRTLKYAFVVIPEKEEKKEP